MGDIEILSVGFYIWWLLVNGCLYTAEFHFIQSFTGIRGKRHMILYVGISVLCTFLVMYYQSPGIVRLILHMGIILGFSKYQLGMKWRDMIAPAMIVLTLFTFMEGFQTVFMRWLADQKIGPWAGILVQMLLSGGLTLLLILTLRFVSKKYSCHTGQEKMLSHLYLLLFPCIFIVWVIRSGLGLDMWVNRNLSTNQAFMNPTNLWALLWILGTCAIFFILLNLVSRINAISIQEAEQKSLEAQIRKQNTYLEEAKKRNQQYRMFQHDIQNHFLVLSGLIHEKNYDEAEKYFEKLHRISDKLLVGIETGNPVIDILLNEKINFAKLNHIEVKHEVQIPSGCSVEDMDLCVILANAIDNAVQACVKGVNGQPVISIFLRKRHNFLIIEVTNTMHLEHETLKYGTGLKNIQHMVEKYEGTMEIEMGGGSFRLTILLCLQPFTKVN